MRIVRKFLKTILLLLISIALALFFLVRGEEKLKKECETLGLPCEQGSTGERLRNSLQWLKGEVERYRRQ